jgi:septal ring factor EnvC (AmiA/AmiB activator)
MLKPVAVGAAIAAWMLVVPGCVKYSDYSTKVTELNDKTDKLAGAEYKVSELYTDLDAATTEIEKSEQARTDAEAKGKRLEQENADLKDRLKKLEQENADLQKRDPEQDTPEE